MTNLTDTSYGGVLLSIMTLAGEYPLKSLHLLNANKGVMNRVITNLSYNKKIVKKQTKEKKRVGIQEYPLEEMMDTFSERYEELEDEIVELFSKMIALETNGNVKKTKAVQVDKVLRRISFGTEFKLKDASQLYIGADKEYERAKTITKNVNLAQIIRRSRLAETYAIMYQLDIPFFPCDIATKDEMLTGNWYVSSTKIKNMMDETRSTSSNFSRFIGCVNMNNRQYIVYNMGDTHITWSSANELKAQKYCSDFVNEKSDNRAELLIKDALVYANDLSYGLKMLTYKEDRPKWVTYDSTSRICVDGTYEAMYLVPLTCEGILQNIFVLNKDYWNQFNNTLFSKGNAAAKGIDCDAEVNGVQYLNFCNGDLVRLKKIKSAYKLHSEKIKFGVFCFSYQQDLVAEYLCGCNIVIKVIDVLKLKNNSSLSFIDEKFYKQIEYERKYKDKKSKSTTEKKGDGKKNG